MKRTIVLTVLLFLAVPSMVGAIALDSASIFVTPQGPRGNAAKLVKQFNCFGTPYCDGTGNMTASFSTIGAGRESRIAVGDFDGDATADVLTTNGSDTDGITTFIYSQQGVSASLEPYAGYTAAVDIASGDVDGDGVDELLTCPMRDARPRVKVFDYDADASQWVRTKTFNAFVGTETGCTVDAGDVDGDGTDEIVVGTGPGLRSKARVFTGDGTLLETFKPYGITMLAGIDVAAGDLTGDGNADIVTTPQGSERVRVKVFNVVPKQRLMVFKAFSGTQRYGASVSVGNVDGDVGNEIVVGLGPNGRAMLKAFNYSATPTEAFRFLTHETIRSGIDVATYRYLIL